MSGRPISGDEEDRMTRLWQDGWNYEQIGKKFRRSPSTARRAILRVVQREAEAGVTLARKKDVRVCPECERTFYCSPSSKRKYCCDACAWHANGRKTAENALLRREEGQSEEKKPRAQRVIYKAPPMYDGVNTTPLEAAKKAKTHRAKWSEIVKRCEELGLSYGEARARGLL